MPIGTPNGFQKRDSIMIAMKAIRKKPTKTQTMSLKPSLFFHSLINLFMDDIFTEALAILQSLKYSLAKIYISRLQILINTILILNRYFKIECIVFYTT